MTVRAALSLFTLTMMTAAALAQGDSPLRKNDRVSIIGNTLADRMQHDGWLETYLASRYPQHNLVFRNLGFAADEIDPKQRLRSANFGSPDQWLTRTKADVVFAFFGANESYAGEAGLADFQKTLDAQIKAMLQQKYNGMAPPRIVLFSPVAFENLKSPNLPDGDVQNTNFALYTRAMAEVAAANKIAFVDLFTPSLKAQADDPAPWTINGIHLNSHGNEEVAKIIDRALAGPQPEPQRTTESLEAIRKAVVDKNFYWFNRYRVPDGYSVYGGRSGLKFVNGQTNFVVMQRELEVLDQLTANRDPAVWAAAQGKSYTVKDKNLPPFIPVETNKKGAGEGGKHLFLDGEAAIAKMKLGKGLKINLFASEKEWPELANPVQMTFDAQGRLWVAVWPTYPHWKPLEPMNDKILVFEDADGDGKADKMTVFADGLHNPTGFELWNGGVIVAHQPDILFLKDTNGDGVADVRTRVLSGLDSADTHHAANSFVLDPGGALYFQEGTFHHTQVETPWGPPVRNVDAGVYRYEPRTHKFETYISFGFANPHGHVFDRWGQDIVVDGTGAVPRHATLFSGQVDFPYRHAAPPSVYKQKTRPCSGTEILSSRHFPESFDGNFLVANVIGFQGILRYELKDEGSTIVGTELEPIVSSTDPNFRPADIRTGPDGAIYFIDWHNPIIGHMQHNLRDPSRDVTHGRIYRVTHEDRPLSKSPKIEGEPIASLLDNLTHPEDRVRYRTRIELSGRPTPDVIAAARQWLSKFDPKDSDYEHHVLEGLWLHQAHNVVDVDLLKRVLRSPDYRARAAATKVLVYQRDRVPEALALLKTQINDSNPRVRLEAIRALSFFRGEEPIALAVELLGHPMDPGLSFVFNETLNTLERRLGGSKIDRGNIAASLVGVLPKAPIERRGPLVESILRHGSADELGQVWKLVAAPDQLPPAVRVKAIELLADAALTRKVKPIVPLAELASLVNDPTTQTESLRLLAAWKVEELSKLVRELAANPKTSPDARMAAVDALADLRDGDSLRALLALAGPPESLPIRFRAAVGMAKHDLTAGADAAARALAAAGPGDDPSFLVEAFLVRKQGSQALAGALESQKISADNAKRVLRAMYLAGRNDAHLNAVLGKIAGFDAAFQTPTSEQVRKIGDDAMVHGDPVRGERVFRRADLGCVQCHALHKAGGNIGPDLGPVGGASPMDYIVQSILDPNASIKEEYLTKSVVTGAGLVVNGIVLEHTKQHLLLRDATGKRIKIAADDIEDEAKGKSLMPEGVTRTLTQSELLDLVRFVSELGKPGPYAMPAKTTMQKWRTLKTLPASLKGDIPNREVVRELLLNAPADDWRTFYSLVNGRAPLDELRKPGDSAPVYLQAEIAITLAGKIDFIVDAPKGTTLWIDENQHDTLGEITATLPVGRRRFTLRIPPDAPADSGVSVEIRKRPDARTTFDLYAAGE